MQKTRVTIAVLTLTAALAVGSTASAKSGDQTVSGACTATSAAKLKVGPRDRRLKVEFEVDSDVKGQTWNVVMKDNGSTFSRQVRKTKGLSGSFEARAKTANQAGADLIEASATNSATGESCTASLSV